MRNLLSIGTAGYLFLSLTACTTPEPKIKQLDTQLDVKGNVDGNKIGISKDQDMVMQEETDADQELKTQLYVNNKLEEDLAYERFQVQRCRDDLADPRLGGQGFASSVPSVKEEDEGDEANENIGLNEAGEYKVVKRQAFVHKLKAERRKAKSYKKMLALTQEMRRECEAKMRSARLQHGLAPSRYEAKGYFSNDGTWVQTQQGEKSLNDAFEIAAKKQEQ